jgi:uracil-DNA glycosylase
MHWPCKPRDPNQMRKNLLSLEGDHSDDSSSSSITAFFGAPKGSAASSTTPGVFRDAKGGKFDKEAWVATLNAEQKALLRLEINTLHESWLAHLKDELVTKEFLDLKRFLKREVESGHKVFPPSEDVYSW